MISTHCLLNHRSQFMEGTVHSYAHLQAESTSANYSGQIKRIQPPAPLSHREAFQTKAAAFSSLFKKFSFSHGILTLTTSCAAEGLDFISHWQPADTETGLQGHQPHCKGQGTLSPQSALVPASLRAGEDAPLPPRAPRKGLWNKIIASLLFILAMSLLYSVQFIMWVTQNRPGFTRLWSNIPYSFTWAVKRKQLIHSFLRGSVLRNKSLFIFHCLFSPCLLFFNTIVCKKQIYFFTSF